MVTPFRLSENRAFPRGSLNFRVHPSLATLHLSGVAEKLGPVLVLVDYGMMIEDVTEFLIRPDLPPTHTDCFDRVNPLGPRTNVQEVNVLLDVEIPGEPSVVIPVAHLVMHVRPVGLTFLVPNRAAVIICLKREQVHQ